MSFDPKAHLIRVQGGQMYLPVAWRLVWFREQHPEWGIATEAVEINHEQKYAIFRASIFNENGRLIATATKREDVRGFGDYIEKAETSSVVAPSPCVGTVRSSAVRSLTNPNASPTRHKPRRNRNRRIPPRYARTRPRLHSGDTTRR